MVEANAAVFGGPKRLRNDTKLPLDPRRLGNYRLTHLLVVGCIELDARTAMENVYDQCQMIGTRPAAENGPTGSRGLARLKHPRKFRSVGSNLSISRPIGKPQIIGVRIVFVMPHAPCPLVRLLHHIETGRRKRIPDSPQLDLNQEESDIFVGMLVESLDGLAMLVTSMGHHPNNNLCLFTSGISVALPR